MAAHDAHGVVAEAHIQTIGHTDKVARIEEHLAIHLRSVECSLDVDVALAIAFETEQLIGNETVDQRDGQPVERQDGIDGILAVGIVGAVDGTHLLSLHFERTIDEVRPVVERHIDKLGAKVAHVVSFVGELLDVHRRRHGEVLFVLNIVIVAVDKTGNIG